MTMQPKAGIATPQGNGKPAKEVFGGGRGVRRAGTISNSTANGSNSPNIDVTTPPIAATLL